jgi:hypothetical protein
VGFEVEAEQGEVRVGLAPQKVTVGEACDEVEDEGARQKAGMRLTAASALAGGRATRSNSCAGAALSGVLMLSSPSDLPKRTMQFPI